VPSPELREQLVACAREMLRRGLVAGTSGNASVREGDAIHVTPTALAYEHMDAADVVTVDAGGRVIAGEREPTSELPLHLAVYAARADARALVHTHSVHATAWSHLGEPLDTGNEELHASAGGTVLTATECPSGSEELARSCVEALEGRNAVLLARHGVVAIADSPMRALDVCTIVERQAQVAWLLRSVR
jgi:L-fuculose-phosphate aldolase